MSVLRRYGAMASALLMGTGLLLAASTGPASAATSAPAVASAPTSVTATTSASSIVPGKARIDRRCMVRGRVLCLNKTTRKIHFMVNGRIYKSADVRFGCRATPTREGSFRVYRKSLRHVSSLYHTPMPWAMFFNGGQAVHYSADFAARGYNGCSHGCANMRSKSAIQFMYLRTKIGDRVIVYRS
jgi:lipoprotein-anchoring transpeptidase ErfK/SrfK